MAKIVFRQEAINDLSSIWEYTLNKWSKNQAEKYLQSIKISCKEIGANPEIGKKYIRISKSLLGFKTGKHIIFYHLISNNEIEIIRILHGRMDLKDKLNK